MTFGKGSADDEVRSARLDIRALSGFIEELEDPGLDDPELFDVPSVIRSEAAQALVVMAMEKRDALQGWLTTVDKRSFDG